MRKRISMHNLSGELAAVDPYVMKDCTAVLNDIYSAMKLGLYYNLLPNRTLAVKDDSCKDRQRSKVCKFLPCSYDSNRKVWIISKLFIQ
jgi:hypothetical protein